MNLNVTGLPSGSQKFWARKIQAVCQEVEPIKLLELNRFVMKTTCARVLSLNSLVFVF